MENARPEYTFRNILVACIVGVVVGALGHKLFGMFDFAENSRANREVIEALAVKDLEKPYVQNVQVAGRFATVLVCHARGMSIVGIDRELMTRSYDPSTDDLHMIRRGELGLTDKPINCVAD